MAAAAVYGLDPLSRLLSRRLPQEFAPEIWCTTSRSPCSCWPPADSAGSPCLQRALREALRRGQEAV